jgi:hypothetical protein
VAKGKELPAQMMEGGGFEECRTGRTDCGRWSAGAERSRLAGEDNIGKLLGRKQQWMEIDRRALERRRVRDAENDIQVKTGDASQPDRHAQNYL